MSVPGAGRMTTNIAPEDTVIMRPALANVWHPATHEAPCYIPPFFRFTVSRREIPKNNAL